MAELTKQLQDFKGLKVRLSTCVQHIMWRRSTASCGHAFHYRTPPGGMVSVRLLHGC